MKKLSFLLFFIVNLALGQSVSILPLSVSRDGGISNDINIKKYSNDFPTIVGIRAGGTVASPTNTPNGSLLLALRAGGIVGANTFTRTNIQFYAAEDWANGAQGTKITFATTMTGTITTSERMVINHDGKVGIGVTSPIEKLHVDGNIRSSSLVGSGVRNVYADGNGTLTTAPQTRTLVVTPAQFIRRNNNGTGTHIASGAYLQSQMFGIGATDDLVASFTLPEGATLIKATAYYNDNDPNNNLNFIILKSSLTDAGASMDVSLFQNTNNSFPYNISSISSATINWVSDADTYFNIIVEPNGLTQNSVGVWNYNGGNPNLMSIKGVKITYTL